MNVGGVQSGWYLLYYKHTDEFVIDALNSDIDDLEAECAQIREYCDKHPNENHSRKIKSLKAKSKELMRLKNKKTEMELNVLETIPSNSKVPEDHRPWKNVDDFDIMLEDYCPWYLYGRLSRRIKKELNH